MNARLAASVLARLGLLAAVAAGPTPSSAQTPRSRSDSAAVVEAAVRAARSAQRAFEIDRIRLVPPTGYRSGGGCDERLGRMCLTHEGDDWWPSPDPPRVVAAREELLRALAEADLGAPGDEWILGQRVVYLGEAGRWDAADSLAGAACAVRTAAWCLALQGWALHQLGRFPEAERAFRAALTRMDPDSARAWLDPDLLLDPRGRAWWKGARDDGGSAANRVWALADPLLLVPGNDQLTEFWSRRTVARARTDARNTYGMSWGWDLAELLLRYGREMGWERAVTGSLDPSRGDDVIGHHDPESRPLMPPGAVLEDPAAAPPAAWVPDNRRPRSAYAPAYAPVLLPADAQLAVFPRGERFVLVGAYALPDDTTRQARDPYPGRTEPVSPWTTADPASGLFLIPQAEGAGDPLETRGTATSGSLLLEAPAGRWVASLEVLDPTVRRAGRIRAGIAVPSRPGNVPTLSELLLIDGPLVEGAALADAAPHALPRAWVRAGERIGIAWELFGFPPEPEALSYRLSLERARPGVLRRAARALGLVGAPPPRRLEWEESRPDGAGPSLRWVQLDLAELEEGSWTIRLEVRLGTGPTLVAEHAVELRGPQG